MFELLMAGVPHHTYTLAATGIKFRNKIYSTRDEATMAMYKIMCHKGYQLKEVYDDKHYKTYICTDGIRFYINRN